VTVIAKEGSKEIRGEIKLKCILKPNDSTKKLSRRMKLAYTVTIIKSTGHRNSKDGVFRVGVKNHLGPYNEAKCRVHIKYNMNY
jgi:hypothetical protein